MRLFLAAVLLIVGTGPAGAQWLDRQTPGVPRKPDGKADLTAPAPRGPGGKPDFTGIWQGPVPEFDFDAVHGKPWVNDLVRQRTREYHKGRPYYQCLPNGPETDRFAAWKRILQTPTTIAILNEDQTYRVIHMDGRELEENPAPSWMGYSVGRWDGDTLIVESVGFNDKTWLSRYGQPHTEALRVTERYRRTDFGHLRVEVTFTDPEAYTKPWGFTAHMTLAADTELLEAVCERSSDHWGGGTASTVTVPPDVLARYVGVYRGRYSETDRTVEILLSGNELIAKVTGAAAVDGGEMRSLIPVSQTTFEGPGAAYQFQVDGTGVATELVMIHISGPYRYKRIK